MTSTIGQLAPNGSLQRVCAVRGDWFPARCCHEMTGYPGDDTGDHGEFSTEKHYRTTCAVWMGHLSDNLRHRPFRKSWKPRPAGRSTVAAESKMQVSDNLRRSDRKVSDNLRRIRDRYRTTCALRLPKISDNLRRKYRTTCAVQPQPSDNLRRFDPKSIGQLAPKARTTCAVSGPARPPGHTTTRLLVLSSSSI